MTTSIDLRSELDVVWRQDFGFSASAAPAGTTRPTTTATTPRAAPCPTHRQFGLRLLLGGLDLCPGEYSHEAQWQHYKAGGELLDAFVFGNWNIGETALGVRAGRHTIFWGQSLLANGAVTFAIAGP